MPKRSAGLLLFRRHGDGFAFLLVHPGGPFWAKKDVGAWSIPKGEPTGDEEPLAAARREFEEELAIPAPEGPYLALGEAVQRSRKIVTAFAVRGEVDVAAIRSTTLTTVWPPGSGRVLEFPVVDRAAWNGPAETRRLILPGQAVFIDRLMAILADGST